MTGSYTDKVRRHCMVLHRDLTCWRRSLLKVAATHVLVPLVVVGCLVLVGFVSSSSTHTEKKLFKDTYTELAEKYYDDVFAVGYAPTTEWTDSVIENIQIHLLNCYNETINVVFYGYQSEEDMVEAYEAQLWSLLNSTSEPIHAGLVFRNIPAEDGNPTPDISRPTTNLNTVSAGRSKTWHTGTSGAESIPNSPQDANTDSFIRDVVQVIVRPRRLDGAVGDSQTYTTFARTSETCRAFDDPGYEEVEANFLMHVVTESLVQNYSQGSSRPTMAVRTAALPCPEHWWTRRMLPIIIALSFLPGTSVLAHQICIDRSRSRTVERLFAVELTVSYVCQLTAVVLHRCAVSGLLLVPFFAGKNHLDAHRPVLLKPDYRILFSLMLLYGLAGDAVALWVSLWSPWKAFRTAILVLVLNLGQVLPIAFHAFSQSKSELWVISSFSSGAALGSAVDFLFLQEITDYGVPPESPDNTDLNTVIFLLARQVMAFCILSLITVGVSSLWDFYKRRRVRPNVLPSTSECRQQVEHRENVYPNVEIRNLSVSKGGKQLLQNVTLDALPGEKVAVLGGVLAGKTALVKILTGQDPLYEGTVLIDGEPPSQFVSRGGQVVGMRPQVDELQGKLSVKETLTFFLRLTNATDVKVQVQRLLEDFSLVHVAHHRYEDLFEMDASLLQLALAFIGDPLLVVLDDPLEALDDELENDLGVLVRKSPATIVMCTSSTSTAERVADKIVLMAQGSIICTGTPSDITERLGAGYLLIIGLKAACNVGSLTDYIRVFVPRLYVLTSTPTTLTCVLPDSTTSKFEFFLANLRWKSRRLRIYSFAIEHVSLDDLLRWLPSARYLRARLQQVQDCKDAMGEFSLDSIMQWKSSSKPEPVLIYSNLSEGKVGLHHQRGIGISQSMGDLHQVQEQLSRLHQVQDQLSRLYTNNSNSTIWAEYRTITSANAQSHFQALEAAGNWSWTCSCGLKIESFSAIWVLHRTGREGLHHWCRIFGDTILCCYKVLADESQPCNHDVWGDVGLQGQSCQSCIVSQNGFISRERPDNDGVYDIDPLFLYPVSCNLHSEMVLDTSNTPGVHYGSQTRKKGNGCKNHTTERFSDVFLDPNLPSHFFSIFGNYSVKRVESASKHFTTSLTRVRSLFFCKVENNFFALVWLDWPMLCLCEGLVSTITFEAKLLGVKEHIRSMFTFTNILSESPILPLGILWGHGSHDKYSPPNEDLIVTVLSFSAFSRAINLHSKLSVMVKASMKSEVSVWPVSGQCAHAVEMDLNQSANPGTDQSALSITTVLSVALNYLARAAGVSHLPGATTGQAEEIHAQDKRSVDIESISSTGWIILASDSDMWPPSVSEMALGNISRYIDPEKVASDEQIERLAMKACFPQSWCALQGRKLVILLWKQVLYQVRSPALTLLQLIAPLIIVGIGSLLWRKTHSVPSKLRLKACDFAPVQMFACFDNIPSGNQTGTNLSTAYLDTVVCDDPGSQVFLGKRSSHKLSLTGVDFDVTSASFEEMRTLQNRCEPFMQVSVYYQRSKRYAQPLAIAGALEAYHLCYHNWSSLPPGYNPAQCAYHRDSSPPQLQLSVHPFPAPTSPRLSQPQMLACWVQSIAVMISVGWLSASFAYLLVRERVTGFWHLQRLCGGLSLLLLLTIGLLTTHLAVCALSLTLMLLPLACTSSPLLHQWALLLISLTLYTVATLPQVYTLQLLFRRPFNAAISLWAFFTLTGALPFLAKPWGTDIDGKQLKTPSLGWFGQTSYLVVTTAPSPSSTLAAMIYSACAYSQHCRGSCLTEHVDSMTMYAVTLGGHVVIWYTTWVICQLNSLAWIRAKESVWKKNVRSSFTTTTKSRSSFSTHRRNSLGASITFMNVWKVYGKADCIKRTSLQMDAGNCYGVLGGPDSGKSTLLRLVVGLAQPSYGQVNVHPGIIKPNSRLRPGISYCQQFSGLMPLLSARETLTLIGTLRGAPNSELEQTISPLLSMFGMTPWAEQRCDTYSQSERCKTRLCAALIADPQIVVLDEPGVGMGHAEITVLDNLLTRHRRLGGIVILATKNAELCERLCSEVFTLRRGTVTKARIVSFGADPAVDGSRFCNGYLVNLVFHSDVEKQSPLSSDFFAEILQKCFNVEIFTNRQGSAIFHFHELDTSLDQMFSILEDGKLYYGLKDYTVSRANLKYARNNFGLSYREPSSQLTPNFMNERMQRSESRDTPTSYHQLSSTIT